MFKVNLEDFYVINNLSDTLWIIMIWLTASVLCSVQTVKRKKLRKEITIKRPDE